MDIQNSVEVVGPALVVLSHVAALLGKPKIIVGIEVLSKLWDVLTANYGKAKNHQKVEG